MFGSVFMQRWLTSVASLATVLVATGSGSAADAAVVPALCASIDRNIAHAQNWLEAGDFKSLAQSAGGLELLAAVLQSQGDDQTWREATGRVSQAAIAVRTAAQAEDSGATESALLNVSAANAALIKLAPAGRPLPPPKANLRSLMLLMDGVRGEAKIALIAGNAEKAKNQAHVLSELGRVVSNLRSGERWAKLSEEFTAASLAAAKSPSPDAQELRPLLKVVSQRCDACHDTR
jgi:hypothetical protein